jgi:BioD-like phosphotransacetylase family protein
MALCGQKQLGTIESGQCVAALLRDGVRMKKNLRYVAIAFVVFYLLSSPRDAANVVNNAFAQLGEAGNQLAAFVNALG